MQYDYIKLQDIRDMQADEHLTLSSPKGRAQNSSPYFSARWCEMLFYIWAHNCLCYTESLFNKNKFTLAISKTYMHPYRRKFNKPEKQNHVKFCPVSTSSFSF